MSTSTVLKIAYRCTKCWQMTLAESDQVGKLVPCVSCSTPMQVPEVSPERINAANELTVVGTAESQKIDFNEKAADDQQIYEMLKQERISSGNLNANVAPRIKRFLGSMIDAMAAAAAGVVGLILMMVVVSEPGIQSMIVFMAVPIMLAMCQCVMIASEGRTLGKYCVKTKIVGLDGKPPGFFQGVVLRVFVVGLLGAIPFFGLADALWIFQNDSNRCLHDLIAGTHVVDA